MNSIRSHESWHQFVSFIAIFSKVIRHVVSFGSRDSTSLQSAVETTSCFFNAAFFGEATGGTPPLQNQTQPQPAPALPARPLLLRLRWKTPNWRVILLVTNYFWLKIKDLAWPAVISSKDIEGKERKEKKMLLGHSGLALKLKTSWGDARRSGPAQPNCRAPCDGVTPAHVSQGCQTGPPTPIVQVQATGHI